MSDRQLEELSAVCNRYPDINLAYDLEGGTDVAAGDDCVMHITLERDIPGDDPGPVHAPRFPGRRDEGWWLVLGDIKANKLLAIKRVSLAKASKVKLAFEAPASEGKAALTLFFMCDSWLGCDQEYEVELNVQPAGEGSSSSGEDSE
jgi:pre-mRNA-splicing helicase BRR2